MVYLLMENKKKYVVYGLLAVLGLGITGYMAAYVVPNAFVTMTKAAPATKVSIADSYFLADKILARADGQDEARVNVYVMDATGKGVAGKGVQVAGAESVEPEIVATNSEGKASFKLKSKTEGQFKITAEIEGVEIDRTITVTFRN